MLIANNWKDYQVIATSDGYKLERWGDITLLRPDPQVIWHGDKDIFNYPVHARYLRSEKGGARADAKKVIAALDVGGGGAAFDKARLAREQIDLEQIDGGEAFVPL